MKQLTERQKWIMSILIEKSDYVSSFYLANIIGVTNRTIQKDIRDLPFNLENNGAQIICKTGCGNKIFIKNKELFNKFLELNRCTDKLNLEYSSGNITHDRIHYVIRKILSNEGYTKIDDLSTCMYLSKSSINNLLIDVKKYIKKYKLSIKNKAHYGLKMNGLEYNIRYCLVNEYSHYKSSNIHCDEEEYLYIISTFPCSLNAINDVITSAQQNFNGLHFSYHHSKIIELCIIISYYRSKYNKVDYNQNEILYIKSCKSYPIAKFILERCEQLLNYHFNTLDYYILTVYVMSFRDYSNDGYINVDEEYNHAHDIAQRSIEYLCKSYNFEYIESDSKLCNDLTQHFIAMIPRVEFGLNLSIVYLDKFQTEAFSPLQYSKTIAYYLYNMVNLKLSNAEISYLMLILHPLFGRYNERIKKRNIIIINSYDRIIAKSIAERLMRNFEMYINHIYIYDICELDTIHAENYDMLFTDMQLDSLNSINIPKYTITPFFSNNEKRILKDIFTLNVNRFDIINLFIKEHFFTNVDINNKDNFYDYFKNSHLLGDNEIDDFITNLKESDNIFNLNIHNNCIVLMTLKFTTFPTFIAIFILTHPINWNNKKVKIIVTIHINRQDRTSIAYFENGLLGYVLINLSKENIVNSLIEISTYENLIYLINKIMNSSQLKVL